LAEPREMRLRDARREGTARFLRQLRELRDQAGLGYAELAARAHYPRDVIKAAECGPSLPDLPVLSAYVRACGGTMAEWEERWRAVAGSPATPLLTARAAGCSEAADAGARVGAASAAADGHDPDRVMAALNRVADGMAAAASTSSSSSSGAGGAGSAGSAGSAAMADAAHSDSFDEVAFEALAADPIAPAADAVVPAARAPQTLDRVPPARRGDALTPAATLAAVTGPATATAAAGQTRSPGHAGLSRIALAVLIAVGLLLVATLIAVVA
jgi:helix-turn-helix protein